MVPGSPPLSPPQESAAIPPNVNHHPQGLTPRTPSPDRAFKAVGSSHVLEPRHSPVPRRLGVPPNLLLPVGSRLGTAPLPPRVRPSRCPCPFLHILLPKPPPNLPPTFLKSQQHGAFDSSVRTTALSHHLVCTHIVPSACDTLRQSLLTVTKLTKLSRLTHRCHLTGTDSPPSHEGSSAFSGLTWNLQLPLSPSAFKYGGL